MLQFGVLPVRGEQDTPEVSRLDSVDPDKWQRATQNSRQKGVWRRRNFDIHTVFRRLWGVKMDKPLKTFHGNHIHIMMRDKDKLLNALEPAFEAMRKEPAYAPFVNKLITMWHSLAMRYQGLKVAYPDITMVEGSCTVLTLKPRRRPSKNL